MVEGPGCKLKGEKMKATVVGQKVKGGNVVDNRPKKDLNSATPYHLLLGHHVVDVKTLGKELFLILDHPSCVRVHFLMAGFVRYNHAQSDPDESARKTTPEKPRLELQLSKDTVSFYQCSTELRNLDESLARWERMITLDICWNMFDAVRATDTILQASNQDRMVVDVIMDQQILPGVGNIIKNESCFDAGINPLTKIKDLTREHIAHLVKMNRDFSMIFYNCRKYGKPLSKHYKMYRFSVCKQCGGKVTKCKPGEYERGTYFCRVCQNNNLKSGPCKGSLLGWAKQGTSWNCEACTLVNKAGCVRCVACGTDKAGMAGQVGTKRKSWDGNSLWPAGAKRQKVETQVNTGSLQAENTNTTNITPKTVVTHKTQGGHTFTFKSTPGQSNTKPGHNSVLKPQNTPSSTHPTPPQPSSVTKQPTPELCKGHSAPCTKKTVSKEGPNKLRLFWSCSLPKAKSCNHFSWADLAHPKCKHGTITLLREVYKMNENNGREFFVCPKPKSSKEQCDFFQWND